MKEERDKRLTPSSTSLGVGGCVGVDVKSRYSVIIEFLRGVQLYALVLPAEMRSETMMRAATNKCAFGQDVRGGECIGFKERVE